MAFQIDWDIDKALSYARAHIRLRHPEDAGPIAEIAMREKCSIWHAGSVFYHTLDNCPCFQCTDKRRAA